MEGKLLVTVAVASTGDVSSVTVSSNSGLTPAVASCVSAGLKRATFDPPPSTSTLKIPISFALRKTP